MNDECVDFGRTADRIYINSEKAVTLSANGGGLGAKTGLYLLRIQHKPLPIKFNAIEEPKVRGSENRNNKDT